VDLAGCFAVLTDLGGGGYERSQLHLFALKKNWQRFGIGPHRDLRRLLRRACVWLWTFKGTILSLVGTKVTLKLAKSLGVVVAARCFIQYFVCLLEIVREVLPSGEIVASWVLFLPLWCGECVAKWMLGVLGSRHSSCIRRNEVEEDSFDLLCWSPLLHSTFHVKVNAVSLFFYLYVGAVGFLIFSRVMSRLTRLIRLFGEAMIPRRPLLYIKMKHTATRLREPAGEGVLCRRERL